MTTKELKLIEDLKGQTVELKALYLTETESWAKKEFAKMITLNEQPIEKWYERFDVSTEMQYSHHGCVLSKQKYENMREDWKSEVKEYLSPQSKEYGRKNLYKMRDTMHRLQSDIKLGLEFFISKALKNAEAHYEDSIFKLAFRVIKKGLDVDNLSLSSTTLDRNFTTRITDGVKVVVAFTILAWGPVNRPHYRYLIK